MIQVVITTWQVPFDQVVQGVHTFVKVPSTEVDIEKEALDFINAEAKKWWDANDGDRCVAETNKEPHDEDNEGPYQSPYEPFTELGYDHARIELWGGETGFHAMLDQASWWRLHEAHYKREFDDKGKKRPGYLRNAYGEDTSAEIAEVWAYYGSPKH